MVFVRQPQHLHRQVFQREQQLSLVFEQAVGFGTAELYDDVGVFNLRIRRGAFVKLVVDVDIDAIQQHIQKIADLIFVIFDRVFARHCYRTRTVPGDPFPLP
jgi:hypothetical protein